MSATVALDYTREVAETTAPLYDKVARVIPKIEWPFHAPYVEAINRLKPISSAIRWHSHARRPRWMPT
jgi:quinolinate synthase